MGLSTQLNAIIEKDEHGYFASVPELNGCFSQGDSFEEALNNRLMEYCSMTKSEKAISCFNSGFNCSQAVISSFADDFGLDEKQSLKIASAFGGGVCRKGDTCGAISGGLMAIGLKHGMSENTDTFSKDKTYELSNIFIEEFKKIYGTIMCRELLGYDLSKLEEVNAHKEKNSGTNLCPQYVGDAAKILDKIL